MEHTESSSESSGSSNRPGVELQTRRKLLNEFLFASGKDTISQPKKMWSQLNNRTRSVHISKAAGAIVAVLDVIAQEDAGGLWEALKSLHAVEDTLGTEKRSPADKVYLEALAETYKNAVSWDTRRQILSIMADLVPYSTIQEFIPGITTYRIKAARHHKAQYGRGTPLPSTSSPRMRVNPSQLDHFLSFITSPHVIQDLPFGQRYLHLSNGKVLETPNVIRSMIPQRIITQYQQYCLETNAKPFSVSTMQRILSSYSATVSAGTRLLCS